MIKKFIVAAFVIFNASGCTSQEGEKYGRADNSAINGVPTSTANLSRRLDGIIPAMYDFTNNPDREVYNIAEMLVTESSECVGHFEGDYTKQFFTYRPLLKAGTVSRYTMGGDRYQQTFNADKESDSVRVVLGVGSAALKMFDSAGEHDPTLFKITSLSKESDGQVVLYGGNMLDSRRGIMQSRIVEMICGKPTSNEWAEKVRHWKDRAENIAQQNFPYV